MKMSILILALLLTSCKTVTTLVTTDDNNNVTMISTEDPLFSSPSEKLRFVFSKENGGQISGIFWEGKKVAEQFSESYPNNADDLKKLQPRIIDDGSGLIVFDTTVRGKFQLRRSFSFKYLEETDEHVVEVIYNVKNYSSDQAITQKWIQEFSLPLNIEFQENSLKRTNHRNIFRIETYNVTDLSMETQGNSLKIGNKESFKLGSKERLSWKVLYILKSAN